MNTMKVDNYSKGILTVIAVCLTILTLKQLELIPKVYAGESNSYALEAKANYGLVPLNEDGSITVKLNNYDELDVNIVGIDTSDELEVEIVGIDTSDELDINIDEIGGGYVSNGGPIPVEIDN